MQNIDTLAKFGQSFQTKVLTSLIVDVRLSIRASSVWLLVSCVLHVALCVLAWYISACCSGESALRWTVHVEWDWRHRIATRVVGGGSGAYFAARCILCSPASCVTRTESLYFDKFEFTAGSDELKACYVTRFEFTACLSLWWGRCRTWRFWCFDCSTNIRLWP